MKKILFTLFIVVCCNGYANAQTVTGTVSDQDGTLAGATVHWAGTNIGTLTDAAGRYSVNRVRGFSRLVVSFLGYSTDTIEVTSSTNIYDIILRPSGTDIEAVRITEVQRGNYINSGSVLKNETISFAGLTKMACCSLAESFENSAAVSVGYSDAMSGARQIRMLGLSGNYTQLLDESRPVLRGLGSPYGLSYTPGMWLQSIQVSKGVASVANGHEGITGQINLEHRKPTDDNPLFVNGYFDEKLRAELNTASSFNLTDRLSTIVLAHGSIDQRKEDHNHDGFLDLPLARQVNFANRWFYAAPSGLQMRAGVKFTTERRRGGDKDFDTDKDRGSTGIYGMRILNRNLNTYLKAAIPVGKSVYDDETDEELRSNVAVVADYNFYDQRSYFGIKDYNGRQNSVYGNLLYNHNFDKRNKLVIGGSFTADKFDETLADRFAVGKDESGNYIFEENYLRPGLDQQEVGAFAEYTYSLREKFTLIVGARVDHNDQFGWFWTPRGHVKWDIVPGLAMRASAGKGYRASNVITDNIGMLATGRSIVLAEDLRRLEESLTLGASLTWSFRLGRDNAASLSFDYFRTSFTDQVIADQEYRQGEVFIYNSPGHPVTNTFQGDFNWSPFTGFDLLATFRYTDAHVYLLNPDAGRRKVSRPLTDNFKGLINLQYATKFRKWVFDFTAQINGRSRLPSLSDGAQKEFSPVYPMFYAQISRKFRYIDVYLGCENIGDYTQDHPVHSAGDPFSPQFNSSVVWGPLMGRTIYAGFRFNLK